MKGGAGGPHRKPGSKKIEGAQFQKPRPRPGDPRRRSETRGTPDHRSRRREGPAVPGGKHPPLHLEDDIVAELRATARPGKGDILVKVFAHAAGAFTEEDYEEAIELGEQSKHIALRSGAVRELLGLAYYRAGRWQEAARELSAYRRLAGSTDQNPVLGDCHRALGKPQRALEICAEIDPRQTDPAIVYEAVIVSAGALADLGRLDEAIARLEKLQLQPDNVEEHHVRAWYALADLLQRKGRFTQAKEWFEAVASADPESTDATDRIAKLR